MDGRSGGVDGRIIHPTGGYAGRPNFGTSAVATTDNVSGAGIGGAPDALNGGEDIGTVMLLTRDSLIGGDASVADFGVGGVDATVNSPLSKACSANRKLTLKA